MDAKSFAGGFLCGLMGRGVLRGNKEPVAYLYNGVRLPKLPEWDKETCPYALIAGPYTLDDFPGDYHYGFVALNFPMEHSVNNGESDVIDSTLRFQSSYLASSKELAEYISTAEGYLGIAGVNEWGELKSSSSMGYIVKDPIIWANFYVVNTSYETIYMYPSEPVPVGGTITPDVPEEPEMFLYGHVAKDGETPTHTIDGVDYVGVILPELPKWNAESYPYVFIRATGKENTPYAFYYNKNLPSVTQDKSVKVSQFYSRYLNYNIYMGWKYKNTASSPGTNNLHVPDVVWTNTDIYYASNYADASLANTVFLSASEPIPITEGSVTT